MESKTPPKHDRKKIAVRFLYTILFMVVLELLKTIIQVSVVFQYIYLFITKSYNEPVRRFANKVSTYAYHVMRYLTLNENRRPFPFSEMPEELQPPASEVDFR